MWIIHLRSLHKCNGLLPYCAWLIATKQRKLFMSNSIWSIPVTARICKGVKQRTKTTDTWTCHSNFSVLAQHRELWLEKRWKIRLKMRIMCLWEERKNGRNHQGNRLDRSLPSKMLRLATFNNSIIFMSTIIFSPAKILPLANINFLTLVSSAISHHRH